MEDWAQWHRGNEGHLTAALAWVRLKLAHQASRYQDPDSSAGAEPQDELARAKEAMLAAEATTPPPALIALREQLGLTRFESHLLLLCAGMELDTRFPFLCAQAQDDPRQPYPTFALGLTLFEEATWDTILPERPLRRWRLLEINQPAGQPLTSSPLSADERVVNYLKGLNYLDDRLSPLLASLGEVETQIPLPPSQQAVVQEIVDCLRQPDDRLPIIQLLGSDAASKGLIAAHVADELGLVPYRLPAQLLPRRAAELENLARLWHRESLLLPLAMILEVPEATSEAASEGLGLAIDRFLAQVEGYLFLDSRDMYTGLGRPNLAFDAARPTRLEQQNAWIEALGPEVETCARLLSAQFNLNSMTIHKIAGSFSPEDGRDLCDELWDLCLAHTRPRLDLLAQRLAPKATWDDIVLPADEINLLREIAAQVRQRSTVYEDWGFERKMNRGFGIVTLFAGPSGTGKTMAAEVIANELRLNLYRIDLSGVVSKYIGETEKNLRQLFDAAEDGGAILFFDEADALFGKRSQVSDSHDRYANIEINYLLQRLEAFQGLAILATNRRSDLDEAFTRRLRFIANFPAPDQSSRRRIWQNIFPAETPLAGMDYDRLAHYDLTGGNIHNAALSAAFLAAQAGSQVTMPLVLKAVRTEFLKTNRLVRESDFRWDGRQ